MIAVRTKGRRGTLFCSQEAFGKKSNQQWSGRQARDKDKLTARINEIKNYANVYDGPAFHWTEPQVGGQTEKRAVVTVRLTLSTEDERLSEQTLTFTTIHKTGWLVCDVAG